MRGVDESVPTAADLEHLHRCIALAEDARNIGRHPFAALVVGRDQVVLAVGQNNSMPPGGNPTQHAELQAAAEASLHATPDELAQATLYSSAEPCVMCAGAIYWTGIGRVVYALSELELLRLTGDNPENPTLSLPCREVFARGQRAICVVGPLLEAEAAAAHRGFWD
ncbi:tRNA(Arg) A34 adenosine deaminase TadA [Cryobacterium psychrophilum]|uniref:Nucleoside deaminase n=1 Tax=Cryobacterium psychrophilum TaxID=41988 RepID=A0A4Y8KMC1_9MICO|nr:tRNA(Arg) A34 adenosine deaminase TadA [Cryobacterium psychrophilum]TFD77407.1 nucleoside deaminase [Cryobacterium psychrophilum]